MRLFAVIWVFDRCARARTAGTILDAGRVTNVAARTFVQTDDDAAMLRNNTSFGDVAGSTAIAGYSRSFRARDLHS